MQTLVRENLSDKLARIIGRQIIQNELKSGEIVYETKISKEWGVSRSPVRDALRMLEQIRLVERTSSGSYKVSEMSEEYIRHFYEIINLFYPYVFTKAAENATKKDIRELSKAMTEIVRCLETRDFEAYLKGVTRYASEVLRIAGNPIVEKIVVELMPTAERVQYASLSFLPAKFESIVGYLHDSFLAIENKDPETASAIFGQFALIHLELNLQSARSVVNEKKQRVVKRRKKIS